MTNAMTTMLALYAIKATGAEVREPVIPEPKFEPFRLPGRALGAAPVAANTAREPRTLEELGVPRGLAREMEAALRVAGLTRGERVTGYTFRTPEGARYALRTAAAAARKAA